MKVPQKNDAEAQRTHLVASESPRHTRLEPAGVLIGDWLVLALPWCLVLLAGLAMVPVMLMGLHSEELDRLRLARVQIIAAEVQEHMQTDLLLGLKLSDSNVTQSLLEKTMSRARDLTAAEVFDLSGRVLFNTDRGSIGEQIPAAWAQALKRLTVEQSQWTLSHPAVVVGFPLRDSIGDTVGYLALSLRPAEAAPLGYLIWLSSLALLTLAAALGWAVWRTLYLRSQDAVLPPVAAGVACLNDTETGLRNTLDRLMADDGHLGLESKHVA